MTIGSSWLRREGISTQTQFNLTFNLPKREALETSLLENEELHTSLSAVEEEKEAVERERDNLKEMAEQAEELAKIVKSLVPDDEEEDNNSEEETGESDNEDEEEKEDHKKEEEGN